MGHAMQWAGLPSDRWARILPDNRAYVNKLCRKHGEMGRPLAMDYLRAAQSTGAVKANKRLRALSESMELGRTGLTATVHDEELKKWCQRHADEIAESCDQWVARGMVNEAIRYAQKRVDECGLVFPVADPIKATPEQWGQALARVFDPLWWRRQVRKIQARKIETVARDIRLVSVSAGIYASEVTVNRRRKQRARNAETLRRMEAASEAGDVVAMEDVVKGSMANPVNRRHELMVRMRGFEECAITAGHVGLFVTITAPSKYHAMAVNKKSGWAYANPKWDGSTPRDSQAYFCRLWSRIRAQLWREEIRPYGFRIAEPHHDGTPHWHMMLHVAPEQLEGLKRIITEYSLAEDGHEPGAATQRVKLVEIDPAKGTAAGYIAKYVAKNIDGENVEADTYGRDAKTSADRIEAWASTWGIRQFQQIGGASVTVWRELRRLSFEAMTGEFDLDPEKLDRMRDAFMAADSSDWAAYTWLQGGMTVRRDAQLIRTHYHDNGLTKYYEPARRLWGVVVDGACTLATRLVQWTIQRAGTAEKQAQQDAAKRKGRKQRGSSLAELQAMGQPMTLDELRALDDGDQWGLSGPHSGPPWTCVSNCTAPPCGAGNDETGEEKQCWGWGGLMHGTSGGRASSMYSNAQPWGGPVTRWTGAGLPA